jgi:heme A synthase
VVLVVMALRRRIGGGVGGSARMLAALLLVQLVVGALNVWLEEYEVLILAHLTLGALLWATSAMLTMQLYRVPAVQKALA